MEKIKTFLSNIIDKVSKFDYLCVIVVAILACVGPIFDFTLYTSDEL